MDHINTIYQNVFHHIEITQNFRALHISLQSVLLTIGIGLETTIFILKAAETDNKFILYVVYLMIFVFIISIIAMYVLYKVVKARRKDMYYWQKLLHIAEHEIKESSKRFFTRYKIDCRSYSVEEKNYLKEKLLGKNSVFTEKDIDPLIDPEKGKYGKYLNRWFFFFPLAMWIILLVFLGVFLYFFVLSRESIFMYKVVLLYIGSILVFSGGIVHLAFTVKAIGRIMPKSADGEKIFMMSWIIGGLTPCFIGTLVSITTAMIGPNNAASYIVYWASIVTLLVMMSVSLFTSARVKQPNISYKLYPITLLFTVLLLILGLTL